MTFYLQASYQGDELVLDNYGLFTLPDHPVTRDEKALFDNISNLVRNSPRPFQKVVTNHVKSALVATLDVIVKEKEAGHHHPMILQYVGMKIKKTNFLLFKNSFCQAAVSLTYLKRSFSGTFVRD